MAILIADGRDVLVDDEDFIFLVEFTWHIRTDPKNGLPYALTTLWMHGKSTRWYMHRAVMKVPPHSPLEVDHIEVENTLDNRESNLRFASRSQNNANRRLFKNNTTGFRGVYRSKRRWSAQLRVNGNLLRLGTFDSPEAAHEVYCAAKTKHFGQFARIA